MKALIQFFQVHFPIFGSDSLTEEGFQIDTDCNSRLDKDR